MPIKNDIFFIDTNYRYIMSFTLLSEPAAALIKLGFQLSSVIGESRLLLFWLNGCTKGSCLYVKGEPFHQALKQSHLWSGETAPIWATDDNIIVEKGALGKGHWGKILLFQEIFHLPAKQPGSRFVGSSFRDCSACQLQWIQWVFLRDERGNVFLQGFKLIGWGVNA